MPSFVFGLVLGCLTPTIVLAWLLWRHRRIPESYADPVELAGLGLDFDLIALDWSGPSPPAERISSSIYADLLANSQISTHQAESSPTPARPPVAAQTPATPPRRHDDASSSVGQEYPRTFLSRGVVRDVRTGEVIEVVGRSVGWRG